MKAAATIACTMMMSGAAVFAQAPLNPTVTVLPQATMPIPPECEGALPPLTVREVPLPPVEPPPATVIEMPPAPAGDARSNLRDAHAAAVANDRASFEAALTRARSLGTASAADRDVIAVFEDVRRLWEYQFSTPTGSFFDATVQDGSLLKMLSRYPGYEQAIQRQTIVDANGTRFYPTRESIEFLLGIAGERLGRTGVRPAPQPTVERQPGPAPAPVPRVAESKPEPQPRPAPSSQATRGRSRPRPTVAKPQPEPQPAPIEIAEEPPMPPGVVTTPSTSTEVDLMPVTTTTTAVVETMEPIEPPPATTTTAAEPQRQEEAPGRSRGIIMPLVLILIGIGVLIVLFRASSS